MSFEFPEGQVDYYLLKLISMIALVFEYDPEFSAKRCKFCSLVMDVRVLHTIWKCAGLPLARKFVSIHHNFIYSLHMNQGGRKEF